MQPPPSVKDAITIDAIVSSFAIAATAINCHCRQQRPHWRRRLHPTSASVNNDHLSTKTTIATAAIDRQRCNGKDDHCRRRHQLPPQLTTRMAITATAIDQRCYCHHHHHGVDINGGGKDAIATTTIDRHCHTTAIGSVPPPPPMTMTAALTLIALALALRWTRTDWQGGGRATTYLIHHRRGCHC